MKNGFVLMLSLVLSISMTAQAKPKNSLEGFQKLKTTAYCMGTTTATGAPVRYGICATDNAHTGYTAIVYTVDGEFIGYFECLDHGGTEAIKSGYVIDIYQPSLEECKDYMKLTGGECLVKYVWAEG